jgi:hypothetical protein
MTKTTTPIDNYALLSVAISQFQAVAKSRQCTAIIHISQLTLKNLWCLKTSSLPRIIVSDFALVACLQSPTLCDTIKAKDSERQHQSLPHNPELHFNSIKFLNN